MDSIYQVIRRPLITEKSTLLKETQRTKPEIKKAVEALFDTKVKEVRVSNVHGKVKRQGRYSGRRPDWKKAFVVLAEGAKDVEFFEQA
jgi:large subunit ribosomal protein L23